MADGGLQSRGSSGTRGSQPKKSAIGQASLADVRSGISVRLL